MAKTVVGLFDDFAEAQTVVQELVDAGFSRNDISIAANQTASGYSGDGTTGAVTGAGEGHAVGKDAGIGAGIGGAVGLLAGLGLLAIPGVGPILAAGPLAAVFGVGVVGSTLSGAVVGGVVGGLVGALTHIGVPKEHAEYYTEGVRRGGTLVTVNAPDGQAEEAVNILNGHGAVDIEERGASYRTGGYSGYSETAAPYTSEEVTRERDLYRKAPATANVGTTATGAGTIGKPNTGNEQIIPVVEEELAVGKRQVQGGGARVHTHVTERPVEESVTLHEEHVTVDRRPVDRAVAGADTAFKEGTIEVTATSEVPVVSKEARVVEEVVVGKTATDRTETVRDTVRRTDVDVEQINAANPTTGTTGTLGTTGAVGAVESAVPGNRVPGVQTGGRDADGSPDTRGITEKVADAVTGDRTDDKTGKPTS